MRNLSKSIEECTTFITQLNKSNYYDYQSNRNFIDKITYKTKNFIIEFLSAESELLTRLSTVKFSTSIGVIGSNNYQHINIDAYDRGKKSLISIIEILVDELNDLQESQKLSPQIETSNIALQKDKPYKIFISHSTKNEKYVKAFVELLESIGLTEKHIFCSSLPDYNVPLNKNIYKFLLKQFTDYSLHLILILSKDYYNSPASLNEMGAGWVLQTKSTVLLLPDFDFSDIKGTIDSHRIGIKLDNDDLLPRLSELRDQLVETFNLNKMNEAKWNRYVKNFSEEIRRLQADK